MSLENCEEDSGNVEGGLEARKTGSWFSKLTISRKKCVPDRALPTRLQSIEETIGKCGRKITSGIGGIRSVKIPVSWRSGLQIAANRARGATHRIGRTCSKRIRSEKGLHPGEVTYRKRPTVLQELDVISFVMICDGVCKLVRHDITTCG
jgi:hypothetical protein